MKTIYVLLIQHEDRFSKAIQKFTGSKYTHVSIALEDDPETFYTFKKDPGFCTEHPMEIYTERKYNRHCRLYSMDVETSVYQKITQSLTTFTCHSNLYKYTELGVILCFLHLRYPRKNRYFCSQFVAEMLSESGALSLPKNTYLYLPNDFVNIPQLKLCYNGKLGYLSI